MSQEVNGRQTVLFLEPWWADKIRSQMNERKTILQHVFNVYAKQQVPRKQGRGEGRGGKVLSQYAIILGVYLVDIISHFCFFLFTIITKQLHSTSTGSILLSTFAQYPVEDVSEDYICCQQGLIISWCPKALFWVSSMVCCVAPTTV